MNKFTIAAFTAAGLLGSMSPTVVLAGGAEAWAEVLAAEPVYQDVRIPVENQVCWDEQVARQVPVRRSATPKILGAIVGGVIGHQFGGGSGQDLMTLAGAAVGASVAADQQHRQYPDRYVQGTERRCEYRTEYRYEERVIAWDVTYRYAGETFRSRLAEEPGDRIRVRVDVQAVEG